MAFDRFLIAPINTGLETDLKPWLIPDDAFARMNNAYVFRGRVRKRFGSAYTGVGWSSALTEPLFSRLRIDLGTASSGNTPAGSSSKIGQLFSIDNQIFTVWQATGNMLIVGTGSVTVATYNVASRAYVFTGKPGPSHVFFYPAEPVMGLYQLESSAVNDEPSMAFDTRWAYTYNGSWNYSTGSGPWHGNDTNLFWACNWKGLSAQDDTLFVSNFFVVNKNGLIDATDDPIWYYNIPNKVWTSASGADAFYFAPAGGAPQTGPYVVTARIIVAFKNRLVLLNTIESDGTNNFWYPFRCRFSAYDSTVAVNSWYNQNQTDSSGNVSIGGGFNDAPTSEEIISAEFIKDRLIVYFENSTWELVWTGNQVYPFLWQKINTELGADATFSSVPFDRNVVAIGTVGVHSCNGANVQRIDDKIPDEIFKLNKQQNSILRVVGIRDYFAEMIYWTFPTATAMRYPNKILVYNYRNNSWAFNDDTITFFGYFEQQTDTTWVESLGTWEESDFTWTSGVVEANFRQVLAGNQQGFVFTINADIAWNEQVLQITNMVQSGRLITITVLDHTLTDQDYVSIGNLQGVTITDSVGNNPEIFLVNSVVDANTITIGGFNYPLTLTGTYAGGAVMGRVSMIDILSKQWNPYVGNGRNFYLARIDFCVDRTSAGEVTVDYYPSGSQESMLIDGNGGTYGTNSNMGNGVLETRPYDPLLYPFEQVQDRLWHPIYFQSDGQTIQIRIYFSDTQIRTPDIAWDDFTLEGLVLHTQPTSARLQ
jgi:hypothetical protein